MSNKEIDLFGQALDKEAWARSRDIYLQLLIDKLDDPDYDKVPIMLDGETIIYPLGVDLVDVVKVLQAGIKFVKNKIFENGDT